MNFKQTLLLNLNGDLERIARRFKNPKITLIVRNLDVEDGDLVCGDDDYGKAIEALNRLRTRGDAEVTLDSSHGAPQ